MALGNSSRGYHPVQQSETTGLIYLIARSHVMFSFFHRLKRNHPFWSFHFLSVSCEPPLNCVCVNKKTVRREQNLCASPSSMLCPNDACSNTVLYHVLSCWEIARGVAVVDMSTYGAHISLANRADVICTASETLVNSFYSMVNPGFHVMGCNLKL